ncbi:hypothetical protein Q5752_003172 [Cryptotrichosporon argae]
MDASFPGALPVINQEAIRLSVLTALALGCKINTRSTFDRKHYFYHDIPASYQITQHYNPIARGGRLALATPSRNLYVGIQQLQIEQDTAKSQRVGGDRLIDLNRAGAGLMEIVTDPDMRSAEEAGAFVRRLQGLLRRVGSGDGDMEKGNLRVDVNVSVRRPGAPFGIRCEIKNLNSVRFLQQAIDAEARRHVAHYETTSAPLAQETRGLDESTGQTYPLRTKEDTQDYRYMPDSNLPAIVIPTEHLSQLQRDIPELPWMTIQRLVADHGLSQRDAETLLGLDEYDGRGVAYFEEVSAKVGGRKAVNWIIHEVLGQINKLSAAWHPALLPAPLLADIVTAVSTAHITSATARHVIRHVLEHPIDASLSSLLDTLGLAPSDAVDLTDTCRRAIDSLPRVAGSARETLLTLLRP